MAYSAGFAFPNSYLPFKETSSSTAQIHEKKGKFQFWKSNTKMEKINPLIYQILH